MAIVTLDVRFPDIDTSGFDFLPGASENSLCSEDLDFTVGSLLPAPEPEALEVEAQEVQEEPAKKTRKRSK
jgi:hypothetical protein